MSTNNNKRSLSNMLRERGGENQSSSYDNQNSNPADKDFEQNLSTIENKDNTNQKVGSAWKKNLLIFVICIVLPVLSYYDYINLPFFGNSDENATTEVVNDFEEGFTEGYNEAREDQTDGRLEASYAEYQEKLNSGELGREFQSWEIDHLYNTLVPVAFLEELQQADMINRLEFWEVSTLVSNGVTAEYLRELDRAGIFSKWEAWEMGNLYEDGVPASYLSELSEADMLQYFSVAELSQLFDSGISPQQLGIISDDLNFNEATVDEIVNSAGD